MQRILGFRPSWLHGLLRETPGVGRLGRWLLDRLLPKGVVLTRVLGGPLKGMRLEVDVRRQLGIVMGRYEAHLITCIEKQLRSGDVGFDIGANLGYFCLVMGRIVSSGGKIVALEPDPIISERLKRNVERNAGEPVGRIITLGAAAGREHGRASFVRGDTDLTGHLAAAGGLEVEVVTLDELMLDHGVPRLVKIDVEGAEADVLEGSALLLARRETIFIIEAHDDAQKLRCTTTLESHGYRCRLIEPERERQESHILAVPTIAVAARSKPLHD